MIYLRITLEVIFFVFLAVVVSLGIETLFFQGAIQFVFLVVSVIFYGLYLFLMRKISPRHKEISEVITSFEYPYINFLSSSPANTLFAFWFHGFTLFAICYTAFEILNKI